MPPRRHTTSWSRTGSPNAGVVDEIENPNPQAGTNNWYTEDGYGGGSLRLRLLRRRHLQQLLRLRPSPASAAVLDYLTSLPHPIDPNCEPGHYYLLNNYNPGYFGDGTQRVRRHHQPERDGVHHPAVNVCATSATRCSRTTSRWTYYGDQWNAYLANPDSNYVTAGQHLLQHLQPVPVLDVDHDERAVRTAHLQDTTDLYSDIKNGNAAGGLLRQARAAGSTAIRPRRSSNLFEGFVKKIVDGVQANPELWESTAIFVTFDEGGGYYDSGYVQPLDFFGDGTRIPTHRGLAVHQGGHISHDYTDHVSILKFIEAQLGAAAADQAQPRQFPQPEGEQEQPVRADEQPGHRRPDGPVQFRRPVVKPSARCRWAS